MRAFGTARSFGTLVLLLATIACGEKPTPTEPAPVYEQKTEIYIGSVSTGGTTAFHFAVVNPGAINATITQMAPISTLTMGLDLGSWDIVASTCSAQLKNSVVLNTVATGTPSQAGEYCVAVVDIGNVQSTIDFTISVTHY